MKETFEAYLDHGDDRQFLPFTCERVDLIGRCQELLETSGADRVAVHQFGEHLFTLEGGG